MSPENRQHNQESEWRQALEALQAGQLLTDSGLPVLNSAISRFYYACFHAARAALLSLGLEPTTHRGVRAEFNRHFVLTGSIRQPTARILGDLQTSRETADYARDVVVTLPEAQQAAADAREFLDAVDRAIHPPR